MKKLIQVSLIVVLVFVLFQAVAGGSAAPGAEPCSNPGQVSCFAATTSLQSIQVFSCLGSKGEKCITPNVGWNS